MKAYLTPPIKFLATRSGLFARNPARWICAYIYAAYAGFRQGHARLIELTGIDTLTELQPVDMHLELNDSVCSELPVGHAYIYSDKHQAYTCTEGPGYYPTLEEKIEMAAQLDGQYFPLHEYMHTIFFGRISGKAGDFTDAIAYFVHDYVVPIPGYAIGEYGHYYILFLSAINFPQGIMADG